MTLVSGFIDRGRYDPTPPLYPVEFYLAHGRAFLALDVPKVVFLEPHVIALLRDALDAAPQTTVVPFAKEELEFWPDRARFLACPPPPTNNPAKDTHDFLILMLNKVDWCRRAAALTPADPDAVLVWVDFGIQYVLDRTHAPPLRDLVAHLRADRVRPGTVRLGGCAAYRPPTHPAQLVWQYCGGVFAGRADALARMQTDQRRVVAQLLTHGWVTWEVTVWHHMAAPYFDRYLADHNATLFTAF